MHAEFAALMPWVDDLGRTLLHFLWQGTVVGAGYAMMRRALPADRNEARYNAGLIALMLLAVCPLATFWWLRPQIGAYVIDILPEQAVAGAADAGRNAYAFDVERVLPWLVLAWGIGVTILAARTLRAWWTLECVVRRFTERSLQLERRLEDLARRFDLRRAVRLRISARIDTPTLIGWIKPVLLLPTAVALGFPRQQIELILAHELGHLRRHDHVVNFAQSILETLFFYHPVVRWISRDLRNEREICCDRLVLRLADGEAHEYARTLAALEEFRQVPEQIAVAATGGVLLDRVSRIVGVPAPGMAAARPVLGTWLLLGVLAFGGGLFLRTQERLAEELAQLAAAVMQRLPRPDAVSLAAIALRLPAPEFKPDIAPVARVAFSESSGPRSDAAMALGVPRPDPAISLDDSLPPIQDLTIGKALPRTPVLVAAATPARLPAAIRRVAPRYDPPPAEAAIPARVEVEFQISGEGTVRDARAAAGDIDSRFAQAALAAVRQWRFDPATLPAVANAVFRERFAYLPTTNAVGEHDPDCVVRTGSRICRPAAQEPGTVGNITIISINPGRGG